MLAEQVSVDWLTLGTGQLEQAPRCLVSHKQLLTHPTDEALVQAECHVLCWDPRYRAGISEGNPWVSCPGCLLV